MPYFAIFSTLVNLNHPQTYVHYSFFSISIANLIIIATMAVIFGLALVLPFPKVRIIKDKQSKEKPVTLDLTSDSEVSRQWTYRLRRLWLAKLPPDQLLPDSQPAYVSSWIYVFGVATLAALFGVIVSGLILAIGGVSWWHQSTLGHFVNSIHLWSVEVFMSFMVIHLWGKFWMAAWRGKRALTWMTGVLAFLISIVEAFTGYLSQQNFDSQWIATNGKDAINATGLGSFFNLMNFGQMITWHIVLIPLVLVFIIAIHIIMVRLKGVSRPIEKGFSKMAKKEIKRAEARHWSGPNRSYDILKEGTIALVVVSLLILGLAYTFSSPDQPPVTIKSWAEMAPKDFIATADQELARTSLTAKYGPPYNHNSSSVQKIGVSWQLLAGVHQPINTAEDFVLLPLQVNSMANLSLQKAINEFKSANTATQISWAKNFLNNPNNIVINNGRLKTNYPKSSGFGPVPILLASEFQLARSGAIDANLLSQSPFYGTNYTKPLLFIEDGNYFSSLAKQDHLIGNEWGVMNEGGSFPGQPWLWLYTMWYQVPGFSTSTNVDLIAVYLTGAATIILMFVPFIPGLSSVPKRIPVYKLIWRSWYKDKK